VPLALLLSGLYVAGVPFAFNAVNLRARPEGLTKYYGDRLIVSETTAAGLEGMLLRCLDRVKVKGKHEPVAIYEPVGLSASVSGEWLSGPCYNPRVSIAAKISLGICRDTRYRDGGHFSSYLTGFYCGKPV
jgi:hypothetical protein